MRDYSAISKRLRRYSENCVAYKLDADFADAVSDAADAIEELLAKVPTWISVEERLPEENKNYLTYGVFLPLGVKAMDMNRFDGTKWLTSADVEITHWMPLPKAPEPPKGVE